MTAPHSTKIRFYHLQQTPLGRALGDLVAKAVSQGRKVLIATNDDAQAATLDDNLWTFRQDAFLAHGKDGDPDPKLTPVWISADPSVWDAPPNGADMLVLTHGAAGPATPSYDMVCDMFDGNDADQLAAARQRWKAAKDAGHEIAYYQQNDAAGWEQKA